MIAHHINDVTNPATIIKLYCKPKPAKLESLSGTTTNGGTNNIGRNNFKSERAGINDSDKVSAACGINLLLTVSKLNSPTIPANDDGKGHLICLKPAANALSIAINDVTPNAVVKNTFGLSFCTEALESKLLVDNRQY